MNYQTLFCSAYNPGQKNWDNSRFFTCFSMEFTANLRYTLINTALTRFSPNPSPPPPWKTLRSLAYAEYVKSVWLVTPNTAQEGGGGGGVYLNYIFLPWNTVSQTFWPGL